MKSLLARALLALVLAAALFAAVIARLRRVPRPRFEPVARYANGRVVLGRVALARRGEPGGQLLGWSVACAGREVIARAGARPLVAIDEGDGGVRVRDGDRVARVTPRDCAVRWERATGARAP